MQIWLKDVFNFPNFGQSVLGDLVLRISFCRSWYTQLSTSQLYLQELVKQYLAVRFLNGFPLPFHTSHSQRCPRFPFSASEHNFGSFQSVHYHKLHCWYIFFRCVLTTGISVHIFYDQYNRILTHLFLFCLVLQHFVKDR